MKLVSIVLVLMGAQALADGSKPVKGEACPGMVAVAAGTFTMGDKFAGPPHEVTLAGFCIDTTEVTVKAYAECVEAKRCDVAPTTTNAGKTIDDMWSQFCNGNRKDRQDHPVNCIDWNQAKAYCEWKGKRLPTEAEWEYAARGSDGRTFAWGSEAVFAKRLNGCGEECSAMLKRVGLSSSNVTSRDNYAGSDAWESTAPVGSFPDGASPFGALDMSGNVIEWVADAQASYTKDKQTNPTGGSGSEHLHRGGGWTNHSAQTLSATYRDWDAATYRNMYLGFRCGKASAPARARGK